MDVLTFETCWAVNGEIIKRVTLSWSVTIKMMHGQINVRLTKYIFGIKLCMFRTVPLSIIRRFSLYIQQRYMSYSMQAVSKPLWHTPLLYVRWKSADDGQRNCPKHVKFYSKNKFEKLVHLVGLIIRMLCVIVSEHRAVIGLYIYIYIYIYGDRYKVLN